MGWKDKANTAKEKAKGVKDVRFDTGKKTNPRTGDPCPYKGVIKGCRKKICEGSMGTCGSSACTVQMANSIG